MSDPSEEQIEHRHDRKHGKLIRVRRRKKRKASADHGQPWYRKNRFKNALEVASKFLLLFLCLILVGGIIYILFFSSGPG